MKMNDSQGMDQEKSVLRWGGLAGLLGSLALIVAGIVSVSLGTDYLELEELFRFPEVRAARTVENSLYLLALLLMASHFLALHHVLHTSHRAPALFGSGLGVIGMTLLAASALLHIASIPLSDLYHAPGATLQDQKTLVLLWQATYGMLDALLVTGLVILPMGLTTLGTAMPGAPGFGKRIGRTTVALGVTGLAAATALLVDVSPIAIVGVFALIVFHLTLGLEDPPTGSGATFKDACGGVTGIAWADEAPTAPNDIGARSLRLPMGWQAVRDTDMADLFRCRRRGSGRRREGNDAANE
jgi:hypothetical protein